MNRSERSSIRSNGGCAAFIANDPFAWRLIGVFGSVVALAWILIAADFWQQRAARFEQAGLQAANMARAVERYVARALQVSDQMIILIRSEIREHGIRNDRERFTELLTRMTPRLNEIVTVAFIDADGVSLVHSNPEIRTGVRHDNRAFFRYHAAATDDRLYVEPPLIGPVTGKRVFTVSRALRDEQGRLLGVIVAGIDTDRIAAEFANLRPSAGGSLGLHHLQSYRILARFPEHEASFARSLDDPTLADAARLASNGVFEGSIADGIRRKFAYRTFAPLPLAVTVGIPLTEIAMELRHEMAGYVLLAVVVTLGAVTAALVLYRAHRQQRRLEADLAGKDALLRAFFDASPVGMCTLDKDLRYGMINPALAAMQGRNIQDYAGHTVAEMNPEVARRLSGALETLADGNSDIVRTEISGRSADSAETWGCWSVLLFRVQHEGSFAGIGAFAVDITAERRNAAVTATVLDLLNVGVWIADTEGRIVRANPAAVSIWHGSPAATNGSHEAYKAWWPASGRRVAGEEWALMRAVREGSTTTRQMLDIECFDGVRKTILNAAAPFYGHNGELLGGISVIEDITDLQKANEAVRVSRDFFENIFNAGPVARVVIAADGQLSRINAALMELTGWSEAEILSWNLDRIMPPVYNDGHGGNEFVAGLLASRISSLQSEKYLLCASGRLRPVLMAATAVRTLDGRADHVIVQLIDIDPQKRVEASLRDSQARLHAVFESAGTAVVIAGMAMRISFCNDAFLEMLGRRGEDLIGATVSTYSDPRDLDAESVMFVDILSGKRETYRIEKRFLRRDKSIVWADVSAAAIRIEDGPIAEVVITIHDVSARKEAELALRRSREQLRELATHQTTLLEDDRAHVAREIHDELGQLLTALKMDVSLLRIKLSGMPALCGDAEKIGAVIDHTITVVRQVASRLRPAAIDLGLYPAIEWLAETFASRWGIECRVCGDEGRIRPDDSIAIVAFRVVQESLTNVARHARARLVEIRIDCDEANLLVTVTDDGCGFVHGEVARKHTLGIFGMRERVIAVGGWIRLNSAPGAGTCVSFVLPINDSRES